MYFICAGGNISENVGSIHYNLDLNTKAFNQAMSDVTSHLENVGKKMTDVGKTLTTRVTLPIAAMGTIAVREAALSAGAMDKFRVVFGEFADDMDSFVDDLRTRMAIPRRQIVALSSGLQDLLVPMGFAREEATNMTKEMLELANQIAVFNDVSPEEVLQAMTSGLTGSSQPLKRFGIDASISALEALALKEGLIGAGESFSSLDAETRKSVQAQALLLQMTRQSSDAIDGYESNLDAIIPRFQDFMATLQDIAAEIGEVLLPVLDDLLKEYILPLISRFKGLDDQTKKNIVIIAGLVAIVGPLLIVLGTLLSSIGSVIIVVKALGAVMLFLIANPIGLLILAIVGLAILIIKNWDWISEKTNQLSTTILNSFQRVTNFFDGMPRIVRIALSGLARTIAGPFATAWDMIKPILDKIRGGLDKINPFHRESPSLVDNVRAGVKEISKLYSGLENIVPNIPSVAGMGLEPAMASNQSAQTYNIQIDRVNDIQDAQMIARELGFRTSLNPTI